MSQGKLIFISQKRGFKGEKTHYISYKGCFERIKINSLDIFYLNIYIDISLLSQSNLFIKAKEICLFISK